MLTRTQLACYEMKQGISLADEYSWNDVKKRSVWEKDFDSEYIQPILEVSM